LGGLKVKSLTTAIYSCASTVAIVSAFAAPVAAQEDKPQTAWEASRTVDEGDVVTTGVARGRDRLNSATSTSAIKENDIVRLAPRSLAELFPQHSGDPRRGCGR